jgi:flagellar hook-length control protein FliK
MFGLMGLDQLEASTSSASPQVSLSDAGPENNSHSFLTQFGQALEQSKLSSGESTSIQNLNIVVGDATLLAEATLNGDGQSEVSDDTELGLFSVLELDADLDTVTENPVLASFSDLPQLVRNGQKGESAIHSTLLANKAESELTMISPDNRVNVQSMLTKEHPLTADTYGLKQLVADSVNHSMGKGSLGEALQSKAVAFDSALLGAKNELSGKLLGTLDSLQSSHPSQLVAGLASQTAVEQLNSGNIGRFAVQINFARPEWHAAVMDKVSQMAAQNLQFAEIQLDPPELGSLQVRVQVNQDQAAIVFNSANAQVKEALENGASRLREMFNAEGFSSVDVDVRDQQPQQNPHAKHTGVPAASETQDGAEPLVEPQGETLTVAAGVDHYV